MNFFLFENEKIFECYFLGESGGIVSEYEL